MAGSKDEQEIVRYMNWYDGFSDELLEEFISGMFKERARINQRIWAIERLQQRRREKEWQLS